MVRESWSARGRRSAFRLLLAGVLVLASSCGPAPGPHAQPNAAAGARATADGDRALPSGVRELAARCAKREWSACDRLIEDYEPRDETYALDVARWACEEGHGSACMKVKHHRAACELGVMEGCWRRFDREGFLLLQRACASGCASACGELSKMGWRSSAVGRVIVLQGPSHRLFFPVEDRLLGIEHGELALWNTKELASAPKIQPLASAKGNTFTTLELHELERDGAGHWRGILEEGGSQHALWTPDSAPRYEAAGNPRPIRLLRGDRLLAVGRDGPTGP